MVGLARCWNCEWELSQHSYIFPRVQLVSLAGFVKPALCTTSMVHDNIVHHGPALRTTDLCCAMVTDLHFGSAQHDLLIRWCTRRLSMFVISSDRDGGWYNVVSLAVLSIFWILCSYDDVPTSRKKRSEGSSIVTLIFEVELPEIPGVTDYAEFIKSVLETVFGEAEGLAAGLELIDELEGDFLVEFIGMFTILL